MDGPTPRGTGVVEDILRAEADAFDQRMIERRAAGFVPDFGRLMENEYFYKSFWRDPVYADLYVGEMSRKYINYFLNHIGEGGTVLDVGCGPGYFALELGRAGFHVTGLDISSEALDAASDALDNANLGENFGSLSYFHGTVNDFVGSGVRHFDGILSSGFLHHIPDVASEVTHLASALRPNGILVLHEPQHLEFTPADAFWIATMRLLLSRANAWFEDYPGVRTGSDLEAFVSANYEEYVLERDITEPLGQSPNDLSADRAEILAALEPYFTILETIPSRSFIYRMLGGLRGPKEMRHDLARLLSLVDFAGVSQGYLNANYFYAVAQKI